MASQSIGRQADALAREGKVHDALRLLTDPAARSEPDALFLMANWRLEGRYIRRDLSKARALFHQAVAAGSDQAVDPFIAFTAAGIGGPADWPMAVRMLTSVAQDDDAARAECALIDAMDLAADGSPKMVPTAERLSDRPDVAVCRGLFSARECAFLAAVAAPRLQPSVIVDPASGEQRPHPIRTSESMAFPYVAESPAIRALNRRIATLTGTDVQQGEPLQVLRYRSGQEYRPHSDALDGADNQRILTVLVTLSDFFDGGETVFPNAGLSFRGEIGDALVFRNVGADGRTDPAATHAGQPVTRGEKLIATRWIRAAPFTLPPPRPMFET